MPATAKRYDDYIFVESKRRISKVETSIKDPRVNLPISSFSLDVTEGISVRETGSPATECCEKIINRQYACLHTWPCSTKYLETNKVIRQKEMLKYKNQGNPLGCGVKFGSGGK